MLIDIFDLYEPLIKEYSPCNPPFKPNKKNSMPRWNNLNKRKSPIFPMKLKHNTMPSSKSKKKCMDMPRKKKISLLNSWKPSPNITISSGQISRKKSNKDQLMNKTWISPKRKKKFYNLIKYPQKKINFYTTQTMSNIAIVIGGPLVKWSAVKILSVRRNGSIWNVFTKKIDLEMANGSAMIAWN